MNIIKINKNSMRQNYKNSALTIFNFLIFNLISGQNIENQNLFKGDSETRIIKSEVIELDNYNDLITIPEGKMYKKYFEKINYFKEIMDYKEFEKYAATKIDQSLYEGTKDADEVFKVIFEKHRHFFMFYTFYDNKNGILRFIIKKPDYGEIFIVEGKAKTNVIGISAGTKTITQLTYNSMMNEVVNYIRQNSKMYK